MADPKSPKAALDVFDLRKGFTAPTGDRFEVLSTLIKAYEDKHFATKHGDPVDVLHFAIESMGRSQAELAGLIGRNRASEVLNRVRPLTLDMIRTISQEWNLPIEALAARYDLATYA